MAGFSTFVSTRKIGFVGFLVFSMGFSVNAFTSFFQLSPSVITFCYYCNYFLINSLTLSLNMYKNYLSFLVPDIILSPSPSLFLVFIIFLSFPLNLLLSFLTVTYDAKQPGNFFLFWGEGCLKFCHRELSTFRIMYADPRHSVVSS